MFALKVIVCLLFWAASCNSKEKQKIYVKSVRCNIGEHLVYSNYSCYVKSFNRTFSTAMVIFTLKHLRQPVYVSEFGSNRTKSRFASLSSWLPSNTAMD